MAGPRCADMRTRHGPRHGPRRRNPEAELSGGHRKEPSRGRSALRVTSGHERGNTQDPRPCSPTGVQGLPALRPQVGCALGSLTANPSPRGCAPTCASLPRCTAASLDDFLNVVNVTGASTAHPRHTQGRFKRQEVVKPLIGACPAPKHLHRTSGVLQMFHSGVWACYERGWQALSL